LYIHNAELEKAFRETKEALDAEKRKALFMLEKEQRNVEQLQQEKNSLRAQMQKLEQMLAEREQQIKAHSCFSSPSALSCDWRPPNASSLEHGTRPVKCSSSMRKCERSRKRSTRWRRKWRATLRCNNSASKLTIPLTLHRQSFLPWGSAFFSLSKTTHFSSHDQTIELMKLQMAEMRDLLEGKVNDLKAKLADERKKIETDITQWKSMAQKELKTRLLVPSSAR